VAQLPRPAKAAAVCAPRGGWQVTDFALSVERDESGVPERGAASRRMNPAHPVGRRVSTAMDDFG